jgi:hypothetical protein
MDHDRCCDSKIQKAHVTDKSTFGAQLSVLEAQEAFLLLGGLLESMGLEANRAARGIESTVLVEQRSHVGASMSLPRNPSACTELSSAQTPEQQAGFSTQL